MSLVMGWLGRSRLRTRPASQAPYLTHPPSTLVIGLACLILFAGLAVASNVFANETTTWWTTSIFVGFALLSVPMVSGFFLQQHHVSEEGLAYRTFIGTGKYLRWSDLKTVRYGSQMKWFRLETRSGTVARVSVMLMGLPEFARLLLQSTPEGSIDSPTLAVLRATAAGNPPSVWV
jgi:hypothetical protein